MKEFTMEMQNAGLDAGILRLIGQNPFTVHDYSESGYSYLGPSGLCIEILNEQNDLNLYIDIDHDEYTVSFDVFHMHLPTGNSQAYAELLDLIDGILHNRICAVSIWCPDSNGEMVCRVSTCALQPTRAPILHWLNCSGYLIQANGTPLLRLPKPAERSKSDSGMHP